MKRGGHWRKVFVTLAVTVLLSASSFLAPHAVVAGVGDRDKAGTPESIPLAPPGPSHLAAPEQFDIAVLHAASFPVKMVFPHIAVANRPFSYFPGERALEGASARTDLDQLAREVRGLIERLWGTVDGHRMLRAIHEANPEVFAARARWRIGSPGGLGLPEGGPRSEVLIVIFWAPQGVVGNQRFQVLPLDPSDAGTTGSGTAVAFRPDILTGALQSDGRIELVAPELALGELLIQSTYPLLGADRGGGQPTWIGVEVRPMAKRSDPYYLSQSRTVRELLAHGGEAERATVYLELLSRAVNPQAAWIGNDPLMRDGLDRRLKAGAREGSRVRFLWEFARKPLTAVNIASDLGVPCPSIVDIRVAERRGSLGGALVKRLDQPLVFKPTRSGRLDPASLRDARTAAVKRVSISADAVPAERTSFESHQAFAEKYLRVIRDAAFREADYRAEAAEEGGFDADLPGHAWEDYMVRQRFLERSYRMDGEEASKDYISRLRRLATPAEDEKIAQLRLEFADC